ncbi:MAG TPA: response regulator transcription factor [Opitutaceae bacterium]|nr:response regulator transcription factor [Opitutaceae bacterium]
MRVLIVEDEKKIAAFVRKGLIEVGFNPAVCHRGDDALALAETERFDAMILDIMLPGRDGLSVLRQLRERRNTLPIILLTARDGLSERLEGLNLGADDYIAKPFSIEELIARLRAVWRRLSGDGLSVLRLADLSLNLTSRDVRRAGKKIELTAREFALLEYLLRSPGRVHTRTQLCEHVWDYHFDTGTNVVDVGIQRLRRKIDDGFSVPLIHTVRGVGYTMKIEP